MEEIWRTFYYVDGIKVLISKFQFSGIIKIDNYRRFQYDKLKHINIYSYWRKYWLFNNEKRVLAHTESFQDVAMCSVSNWPLKEKTNQVYSVNKTADGLSKLILTLSYKINFKYCVK